MEHRIVDQTVQGLATKGLKVRELDPVLVPSDYGTEVFL
jgi:hypothetical protein